jgi:NTE family protein
MTKKTEKNSGEKKKIAVALQGGGSHGAFTWGVLDALLSDGRLIIEGLSGTSAGAMNALCIAQGIAEGGNEGARHKLNEYWGIISENAQKGIMKPGFIDQWMGNPTLKNSAGFQLLEATRAMMSPYQFNPLNKNPLKDMIEKIFDFDKIKNSKDGPKVFLCATHVATGKLKIFKNEELSIEAVLASACLPTLFQAVEVNGEFYWDGGFIGNPAIYPIIENCSTPDIVVLQLSQQHRPKLPTTNREITDRFKEITYNGSLLREMRAISFITKLIDKGIIGEGKMKRLYMHLIRDQEKFLDFDLSNALNSTPEFINDLHDAGIKAGQKWIKDNYEDIGKRSTFDVDASFVEEEK